MTTMHHAFSRPAVLREALQQGQRACRHLASGVVPLGARAKGPAESSCERNLGASLAAHRVSFHAISLDHAQRALSLAIRLPRGRSRWLLSARAMMAVGRGRWLSPAGLANCTLDAALEALLAARAMLSDQDPVPLRAELSRLVAGVSYDIGTPEVLADAVAELRRARQMLVADGRPLEAAGLLGVEAATWIRLGDSVRASRLLHCTLEALRAPALSDAPARRELAETSHIASRLLLQAHARPGREREALTLAVRYALAAEAGYRELGDLHHLARTWETLGRAYAALRHRDDALRLLGDARNAQRESGDAVGLARSAAALADLLSSTGNHEAALERLAESVETNLGKGSPIGMRFNLWRLEQFEPTLPACGLRRARELGERLRMALRPVASRARVERERRAPAL